MRVDRATSTTRSGPDAPISLNVAAKQADDIAFMPAFVDALAATGCAERFMLELTEEAFFAKSRFQTEVLPHAARHRRPGLDRRFRRRLFVAGGAGRHHGRRDQDRPLVHHRHPRRPRSQCVLRAIESLATASACRSSRKGSRPSRNWPTCRRRRASTTPRAIYFATSRHAARKPLSGPELNVPRAAAASAAPRGRSRSRFGSDARRRLSRAHRLRSELGISRWRFCRSHQF